MNDIPEAADRLPNHTTRIPFKAEFPVDPTWPLSGPFAVGDSSRLVYRAKDHTIIQGIIIPNLEPGATTVVTPRVGCDVDDDMELGYNNAIIRVYIWPDQADQKIATRSKNFQLPDEPKSWTADLLSRRMVTMNSSGQRFSYVDLYI